MADTYSKAQKWVNIFNPDDAATAFAWKYNNAVENLISSINWPYGYNEDTFLNPFGDNEYVRLVGLLETEVPLVRGLTDGSGNPGKHAYEILAFLGQANAMPIGTKPVEWFGENNTRLIDLVGLLRGEVNEDSPLYSASRKNHSFQFHHDAMTTWPFWLHIKQKAEFDATY